MELFVLIGILILVVLIFIFLFYLFIDGATKSTTYDDQGISVSNLFSKKFIPWDQVNSASFIAFRIWPKDFNFGIRYDLNTTQGQVTFLRGRDNLLESILETKGGLKVYDEEKTNVYSEGNISPGYSKRWSRPGQEYKYTSPFNAVNDQFFKKGKQQSKLFFVLSIIVVLGMILALFYLTISYSR